MLHINLLVRRRVARISHLILCILLTIGCDDDREHEVDGNKIYISQQTPGILLEFTSSADNKTIPVYIAFPQSQQGGLKAVVVLHGSGGPWDDDDTNGDNIADVCHVGELSNQNEDWEQLLNANGFVAVFPDSYSPRGTCENEGDYKNPPLKFKISGTFIRNHDAQDVLTTLQQLAWKESGDPIIDIDNVALVGFSDGGTSVISTLYDEQATPAAWVWKQSFNGQTYTKEILPPEGHSQLRYKAGVIYYPGAYHNGYYGNICTDEGIYRSYADVMIHLAEEDALSENSECLITTMTRLGGGIAMVHRYNNADHGFDGSDEPHNTIARERSITFLKNKFQN
jgi:dienelactone hydrolase